MLTRKKSTFQSTLPYGSDQKACTPLRWPRQFQSTLPYGSDCRKCSLPRSGRISIHAPLRERHMSKNQRNPTFMISIHAPLRERLEARNKAVPSNNFNPRSLTGATPAHRQGSAPRYYFNPRSLTGATNANTLIIINSLISIHAPLRERHGQGFKIGR